MDVLDFINREGKKEIPNPQYNSKSKKNKVPRTITALDLEADNDAVINMAVQDYQNQYSISAKDAEKYRRNGLNWNPWEDLDKNLADEQSAFKKFGNALAQTIVSEVALGTAVGIADLFDIIGSGIGLNDGDYQNPVSRFLEEKQEEFRNFAPIYADPNKNISNGGLIDAGWWASNIPSIMSSLTLLIPSTGVAKGLGYLGKISKAGKFTRNGVRALSGASKRVRAAQALREAGASAEEIAEVGKLSKAQRFLNSSSTVNAANMFLENGLTAVTSRALENYQEARQTYNDMYADASETLSNMSDEDYQKVVDSNADMLREAGVDTEDRDAVAKEIAKKAADRTFQIDWMNVGWDVLQMYALKDAWKGLKNSEVRSSKVYRAQKDASKYFGKTEAEIAAAKAQRSFGEKAKEWAEDRLVGSKLVIGAELSEGAEEALNYIATEEGMHFGNVLLGKEKGSKDTGLWTSWKSVFDDRLAKYIQAPQLWDSAFWGVMGGVVFEGLGSQFNKISNKFKEDDTVSKEAKEKLPWYQLDELPETKRRISEIQQRATSFQTYKDKLDRINKGEDIYSSTDENIVKFTNEAEQQAARDKLKKEYIADMTLRAMNSGNLDMLKAYLADENVRKGMVESGIFNVEGQNKTSDDINRESKEYIDDALRQVDEVEQMYDQELVTVNEASAILNAKGQKATGDKTRSAYVPAEYMQIIATDNVKTELAIANKKRELAGIEERISQLETQFADKLDPNINHRQNIKLGVLIKELGNLRAERKRLSDDDSKSLSNQIAIANIDKRIASIEQDLSDAELTYATYMSLRYVKDDKGIVTRKNTAESLAYKDAKITQNPNFNPGDVMDMNGLEALGLSDRSRTALDEATVGEYKTLEADAETSFATLSNISPELDLLYQRAAVTSKVIDFYNNDIARTVDEVAEQVGMLHNTMNEARVKAINQANDTIRELYRKYGHDVVNALYDKYYKNLNGDYNDDTSSMTDEERSKLTDAIDVLALTKSYNQSLARHLETIFFLEDAMAAGRSVENKDDKSQSSTTNQQSDTSQLGDEIDNSSTDNTQSNTEQNNGQIEDIPQQFDQQNIQNRTPSFYAKWYLGGKDKGSVHHSSKDNGGVAVYDNGDGTFTIDVRGDKKLLKAKDFFSNADGFDITRDYEVASMPIARRNKKGKLEIIYQGELRYTDTLEAQQEDAESNNEAEQVAGQADEQTTNNPSTGEVGNEADLGQNDESNPTPATESTQTQTEASQEQPATDNNVPEQAGVTPSAEETPQVKPAVVNNPVNATVEPTVDQSDAADEIKFNCLGILQRERHANKDVDLDAVAKKFVEDLVKTGADRVSVEKAAAWSLGVIKRRIARMEANAPTSMQSSVEELIITQSSIVESSSTTGYAKEYVEKVRAMMEQYAKEMGLNRMNGKYYVTLEDLLRYSNQVTSDSTVAGMIYQSLKEYLKTDEARKDYALIDEQEVDKSNFINNVAKSSEERQKEREGANNSHRIDINSILSELTDEQTSEYYDALDALNKGDKLSVTVDNKRLSFRDKNGKVIGTIPVTKRNAKTGAYEMVNDGWIYDILSSNNGAINSRLKDTFFRWLTSKTDDCVELNSLIYELAFTKATPERKQELLDKFANNAEVKAAKEKGLVAKQADNKQLINGLVKLWRFTAYATGDVSTGKNIRLKSSIEKWFKKLNASYDFTEALLNGAKADVTITSISDGELIRIVENDKVQAEQEALPVDKAIAGGVNPEVQHVAIADNANVGMLKVAGMPMQTLSGVGGGNTFVIIPNRSGRPGYAQAFPAGVVDDYIGQDAKDIVTAVKDEVTKLLNEFANNPSDASFDNLKTFFEKLLSGNNGNRSMFRGLSFTSGVTRNGVPYVSIALPGTSNMVNIFKKGSKGLFATKITVGNDEFAVNSNGKKTKNVDINSPEAHRAIKELINNLKFQVSYAYVDSDNVSNMSLKGFATRSNGKFEIKIGDKTWTYNSYNEFMLNNNLLRVNTKPSEDGKSNYSRRGIRSQKGNQTLEVSLATTTTSPVEENGTAQQEQTPAQPTETKPTNITINEQVTNILNSNSNDKGVDIVKTLVGTDPAFTESTLKAFQSLGILPKNIKFDAEFNNRKGYEHINAEINTKTHEVTVGKRWLDMFSNPLSRKQAIRKLIHEGLHDALSGKNKRSYLHSAKGIYEEFKAALESGKVDNAEHFKQYLFENETEDRALEEFLVESLTSEELARTLNSIDAVSESRKGSKNLLQKVLELMAKVFGWDVRKGSLYEKELNTLRASMQDDISDRTAIDETVELVNKIQEDGEKANLTEDEVYYINSETNELGVRVTSAIQADEENVVNGIPKRFDKNSPWVTPSTNIGTGVDEFTRDFFLGKLDNMSDEELEAAYPNVTGSDWAKFREQLKTFKDDLKKGKTIKGKNITIVSRDIKAIGKVDVVMPDGSIKKLNVTGTLDLLGYDQDGKFYIFDMKTVHSEDYMQDIDKSKKWNRQLQLYKQCLEDKYGVSVAGTYIIPIKVNYDTPKGAKRKDGTDMGGTAVYSVRNPELKRNYDNPNRSQILQDGEEFRGAAPDLRSILSKNPHPGKIRYEYLDDAAKDVLDGKVTAENYKNKEAVTQTEQTSTETTKQEQKPQIEVKPVEEPAKPNKFGSDNSRRMRGKFKSSITEMNNTTPEMETIKANAIANGTFMKAPNGNPTNLSERQWLQVRTESFKGWFGDWENNPSQASKVVDENGEPLVVYHGSKSGAKFDTFKSDVSGRNLNTAENSFFFISDKNAVLDYSFEHNASNIMEVFLNIRNPHVEDYKGQHWTGVSEKFYYNHPLLGKREINVPKGQEDNVYRLAVEQIYGKDAVNDNDYIRSAYEYVETERTITNPSTDELTQTLDRSKFDGIIAENVVDSTKGAATDYIAFNSNQIKSATNNNGDFSTTDDNIHHSSVTELGSNVPSVQSLQERLPIDQQPKFAALVRSAAIQSSCR
jgi:hypothetical protein